MEIRDEHGLSVALVDTADLAARPWLSAAAAIDVVRMVEPPEHAWEELEALGFIRKPDFVCWRAELGPGEPEYLARLEKKPRYNIRRARDRAAAELRLEVHDRIDPDTLDMFLELYRSRIEDMPFGVPIACHQRERLLDGPEKYFAVIATDGGELAGGCVVKECPQEDAIRIRFSAVTEHWRKASLARTLYFEAMRVARDKGYRYVTLGDEPNLYGHMTKAGLFSFKAKMGFECVPSQDFHDEAGRDLADLVISLRNLHGTCLILGYTPTTGRKLTANLITEEPLDTAMFAEPFLTGVEQRPPGPPA
jgi:predicted N-acetyltransferase YhbS